MTRGTTQFTERVVKHWCCINDTTARTETARTEEASKRERVERVFNDGSR